MAFFPLINIAFLILMYRVHRKIFWIATIIEVILYVFGVWYIEDNYRRVANQIIYYLALTGTGLIIGVAGFLIAITLNHKHLYTKDE